MNERQFSGGNIRKLWPTETDKFRDHLLRLDKMSRRLRFAHGVSDSFIEDYAGRTTEMGALVYAYFEGGQVRAAAELKKLGDVWGQEAEAAFSVEQTLQDQGIGSELMGGAALRVRRGRRRDRARPRQLFLAARRGGGRSLRLHDGGSRFAKPRGESRVMHCT